MIVHSTLIQGVWKYIFFTLLLIQLKLSKKVEFYQNPMKPINTVTLLYHTVETFCVGMMFLKEVSFVHQGTNRKYYYNSKLIFNVIKLLN